MYCMINMETGKKDRVCYEAGDVLIRRGHSDKFLITKVEKRGYGYRYYAVWEDDLSKVALIKGRMELVVIFKPYLENVSFYK